MAGENSKRPKGNGKYGLGPSPKRDKMLDYLIKRRLEQLDETLDAMGQANQLEELGQYVENQLTLMLDRELIREYNAEKLVESGQPDPRVIYNQPQAKADFPVWARRATWTIDAGVALLLEKSPDIVTWAVVSPHTDAGSPLDEVFAESHGHGLPRRRCKFADKFAELRSLALSHVEVSLLTNPVTPSAFLAWARKFDLNIPEELDTLVDRYWGGRDTDPEKSARSTSVQHVNAEGTPVNQAGTQSQGASSTANHRISEESLPMRRRGERKCDGRAETQSLRRALPNLPRTLTGIRSAPPLPTQPCFKQPRWEHWTRPGTRVRLWEGICLIVGIEPPQRPGGGEICNLIELRLLPQKFHEAWDVLNRDDVFSDECHFPLVGTAGRMLHTIQLDGLAHWALYKGFDVAPELQKIASRFNPAEEESASTVRPEELSAKATTPPSQRKRPQGGDTLTRIIWDICYDIRDAGEKPTPVPVMRKLKIRAQSAIAEEREPLVASTAGGVKYEDADGEERELNTNQLQSRINEWKKANS